MINFMDIVRVTNPLNDALKASGTGAIVNVSSGGNTPFNGFLAHYGAAKAALNAYTLTLAKELALAGVRVNIGASYITGHNHAVTGGFGELV